MIRIRIVINQVRKEKKRQNSELGIKDEKM